MVVSRLKSEASKLKNKDFAGKAQTGIEKVSDELNKLRQDVRKGEQETEKVKQTKSEQELEKDLEKQRNIFKEFEHVEGDIKKILTLEEHEIENLHKGIEQSIQEEKEIEATILALSEEIDKIEQIASEIEQTLTQGERKFNTDCVKQAIEYGSEQIYNIYDNAESQSTASLMIRIENILKRHDANEIGSRRENFASINLQQELKENEKGVVKLATVFNELLYELGENCVDKQRYKNIETELQELQQLFDEVKQIAEQLEHAIQEEKEIIELEKIEQHQIPQTVEGLKELGQELQILGKALEEEEATEKEIMELTRQLKTNPRQANQQAQNEVEKLENNLQNIEQKGHKIEAEAEKLEIEQQKIGELNKKEEEQLKQLLDKGEKVQQHLKKVSQKLLHSDKIAIGPDKPEEREKFKDRANQTLEMKLSIGVDQTKQALTAIINEAEKLEQLTEKEEQIELEISQNDLKMENPI